MVKKLMKYDLLFYMRSMFPMLIIMLSLALFNRIIQFFENDSSTYDIIFTSSVVVLVIACLVCLVMATVKGISRFYKNLFTQEGYLSMTLPVTPTQHLVSKVLTATIVSIVALIAVVAAVCVATAGDVLVELVRVFEFMMDRFFREFGTGNGIYYIIQIALLVLAAGMGQYLLFYLCICVGQMGRRNRVALAFGVYYGISIIVQIVMTLILIFAQNFDFYPLLRWIGENPHISLWLALVMAVAYMAVCFIVCRVIMKKKLNLE